MILNPTSESILFKYCEEQNALAAVKLWLPA